MTYTWKTYVDTARTQVLQKSNKVVCLVYSAVIKYDNVQYNISKTSFYTDFHTLQSIRKKLNALQLRKSQEKSNQAIWMV